MDGASREPDVEDFVGGVATGTATEPPVEDDLELEDETWDVLARDDPEGEADSGEPDSVENVAGAAEDGTRSSSES